MYKTLLFNFALLIMIWSGGHSLSAQSHLRWAEWTELPANPVLAAEGIVPAQPGLAGVYSGVSHEMVFVAGGANFPKGMPWEGGEKKFWNQIYYVPAGGDGTLEISTDVFLPVNMAYGVSLMYSEELFLIGGENETGTVREVFSLSWNKSLRKPKLSTHPNLPEGVKAVAGGILNGRIYIHGVQDDKNILLQRAEDGSWVSLPGCPGPAREFAAATVQTEGYRDGFFLFSGRTTDERGNIKLLTDGYMYDPIRREWKELGPIGTAREKGICVMGAAAVRSGASHIYVFGGDRGEELLHRINLAQQISDTDDEAKRRALEEELERAFTSHRGFSRDILAYHTLTNTWTVADTFPGLLPVTTQAFEWGDHYFIPGGEIHPGRRTPILWKGEKITDQQPFGWLNYSVILMYFLIMLLIGIKFSRRQKTTEDYFKGGGRIPWWAAGLSLFGTSLSAITFMAIPAKTYMTDWGYFFFQMTPLLAAPILISLYIPYFRKLNITSAYEYLEQRFNLATRLLGSLSFIILQMGRVGIILFLPSIAINLVTGISIELCIISMGIVSVIYTMMGGIEAVIWTDVLQVVILMSGALLSLILLLSQTNAFQPETYHQLAEAEKFQILETAFDFTRPTIWVVLLGGLFANLITSGSDQTMVQRYLTTATEDEAKRSVWTFALLAIPATLIFFSIGTALYLFYQQNPQNLDPNITNDDAVFPWYIVSELPAGVSGLLIAGILSAAMSSLSSSMNSVSTAFITDFYHRFSWGSSRDELSLAKIATLAFGVIGTSFALMMASWNIQSLWDQFQLYIGLFASGLGALFLLGMTMKKANGRGAVIGLILSVFLQYFLMKNSHLHVLMFAATGFISCFVFSYLFSLIFPRAIAEDKQEG